MATHVSAANGTVELQLNTAEAELVLDGLKMLSNCRRYGFKEPNETIRELHGDVLDLIERVEGNLKHALRK